MTRLLDIEPRYFVKQLTCDKCGVTASSGEHEFHNFVSLDFDCTWGSALGDGRHVDLDLCHECVKELLLPFLRITDAGWSKPAVGEWSELDVSELGAGVSSASVADKLLATKARMQAQAEDLVMSGTRWLTALELSSARKLSLTQTHAELASLSEQGQIFGLEKDGERIYPAYALDPMGEPVPVLKQVLEVFQGCSPFQVACWFESPSGYLRGKRPRELLAGDGVSVLVAAKRTAEGALHG